MRKQHSKVHDLSESDSDEDFRIRKKQTSDAGKRDKTTQPVKTKNESLKTTSKSTLIEKPSTKDKMHAEEDCNKVNRYSSCSAKPETASQHSSNAKSPLKRKHSRSPVPHELRKVVTEILSVNDSTDDTVKPICKYGSHCYRKNPSHIEEYFHLAMESKSTTNASPPTKKKKVSDEVPSTSKQQKPKKLDVRPSVESGSRSEAESSVPRSMLEKYQQAQPYSFFLTKVSGIDNKYNASYTMDIKEILSSDMGQLKASCQFNYMFEIAWLIKQYPPEFRSKPLLIVHGEQGPSKAQLQADAMTYSNIKFCQARLEMMYGTHHTKMMLLLYDNGMRVVIHTSNLIERDWFQKTQGIWVSPVFPRLQSPSKEQGESPTFFKRDLIHYIAAYKAYQLKEWIEHLEHHDMSAARVVIVGSVPGRHQGENEKCKWGHLKLRKILSQHGPDHSIVKTWPVIGQFSSIGSMGGNKENWVCGEFLESLAATKGSPGLRSGVPLQLIFPSRHNVRLSLEGYPAGGSIPYSVKTAQKQTFLHDFFHLWMSEGRGRSRAMPHIKTYIRPKQDGSKAAWFLVTSANLSKAAWGALEKKGSQLMIRSYEIGVLLLPKFFENGDVFNITSNIKTTNSIESLVLPYDLPAQKYEKTDRPWMWDVPYMDLPDTNGNVWCPFSK